LERIAAAAQRLELGIGIAAVGGEILVPDARELKPAGKCSKTKIHGK
jgi:hypothetical protein